MGLFTRRTVNLVTVWIKPAAAVDKQHHRERQTVLAKVRDRKWTKTKPDTTIDSVADSVGFKSADAFRRAFERRYGLQPSNYRKHFSFHPRK